MSFDALLEFDLNLVQLHLFVLDDLVDLLCGLIQSLGLAVAVVESLVSVFLDEVAGANFDENVIVVFHLSGYIQR
mgnify:CR=1 FL=1